MCPGGALRILHVVARGMSRGGVESWLMRVLRHINRERFHMDFLVGVDAPCAYDEEIRSLGSEVIVGTRHRHPLAFRRSFGQAMAEHGPYDIVHSHIGRYSGLPLGLARRANVPVRIVHVHGYQRGRCMSLRALKTLLARLLRASATRYATVGLGCSRSAATALFGTGWEADGRWSVLHCGIDTASFEHPPDRNQVRSELGLGPDHLVVGHVGNFYTPKNHPFLVEIAAALVRLEPACRVLLIGRDTGRTGEVRRRTQARIKELGIADRVQILGERNDVPRLMLGAMDAFVLPSLSEGLPVSMVEAQAAGLPCVYADTITDESEIIPALLTRMPLSAHPEEWARALLAAMTGSRAVSRADALETVKRSSFNIERSVEALSSLYEREVAAARAGGSQRNSDMPRYG
ncbi:MAG: glycosyltransferase [Armatimonadetes bacterium]|nr:glycosyltransferase [Armatimonadota bacterium]